MGDLIDRQAAIDALNKLKIYRPLDSDRYVISDCLNKIVNLPSAQPEITVDGYADGFADGYKQGQKDTQPEIIYCKDCKYYVLHVLFGRSQGMCERLCDYDSSSARLTEGDDFCSQAEKENR